MIASIVRVTTPAGSFLVECDGIRAIAQVAVNAAAVGNTWQVFSTSLVPQDSILRSAEALGVVAQLTV